MSSLNEKIINLGWRAASQHDIDRLLTAIIPTARIYDAGRTTAWHGWCDTLTGVIQVRTHTLHKHSPRVLVVHTIIDTLAHELAHLMEPRHGRPHRNLTIALRAWLETNWGADINARPPFYT
jgi:hypothetical protein